MRLHDRGGIQTLDGAGSEDSLPMQAMPLTPKKTAS